MLLYAGLGYAFSDRVQTIADVLGSLVWVIVGVLVAALLGWKLWKFMRSEEHQTSATVHPAVSEGQSAQ